MLKSKQRDGIYREALTNEAKQRYLKKIAIINDKDPYLIGQSKWSRDFNELPPLTTSDIFSYLVCGVSAYTSDQFKNYKSLEAHVQFTNGWVQDLGILKADNDNTVVCSQVLHSQRLNETPLKPWVIIAKNGQVLCAHCTCMAGIAESCTHVGALLFKIEAAVRIRGSKTVTDVPAYWKLPSALRKVQPEVGYKIDFSSAAAQKKALDLHISGRGPVPGRRTHSSQQRHHPYTLEDLNNSLLPVLHKKRSVCMGTMNNYFSFYKDPIKPVVLPEPLQDRLRDPQFDAAPLSVLSRHCETVRDIAAVTPEQANTVELHTRQQHKTPGWYRVRAGRITASNMHAVLTTRIEEPAVSTVIKICYPSSLLKTPAVQWGIQHEETARSAYQATQSTHHANFKMELSGFIINPSFPEVGASPDGIINCACCGKGCLEVKCPAKHKAHTIQEACNGDRDFCLHIDNGSIQLKKGHRYYTQVQTQIFVSEARHCDFVVWTTKELSVTRVMPDRKLWDSCLQKAQTFFLRILLPELVAHHYTGDTSTKRTLTMSSSSLNTMPQAQKKTPKRKSAKKDMVKLWCLCDGPEELEDMVACDNQNCPTEWFHLSCVGLKCAPAAEAPWMCPSCL